jgi:hypothetical protein
VRQAALIVLLAHIRLVLGWTLVVHAYIALQERINQHWGGQER